MSSVNSYQIILIKKCACFICLYLASLFKFQKLCNSKSVGLIYPRDILPKLVVNKTTHQSILATITVNSI